MRNLKTLPDGHLKWQMTHRDVIWRTHRPNTVFQILIQNAHFEFKLRTLLSCENSPRHHSWTRFIIHITMTFFLFTTPHNALQIMHPTTFKGDLRTICRFSYMKVYKLITLGTKFKTLLSLGRKITMFSKFITNYIEQGWWHSSLTFKCMHLLLKEVNKRGRHAYNLHGWTCLPSGIVMEIHCHITGIF